MQLGFETTYPMYTKCDKTLEEVNKMHIRKGINQGPIGVHKPDQMAKQTHICKEELSDIIKKWLKDLLEPNSCLIECDIPMVALPLPLVAYTKVVIE